MLKLRILLSGLVLSCLSPGAFAQTTVTLNQVWKDQAVVTAGAGDFLTTGGDSVRGMGLNTNVATGGPSVLVASRVSPTSVRRLDPATGALKTPATLSTNNYFTTSTFQINKVVVDDAGVIYVCSLANAGSSAFVIYRYANETADPTIAYQEAATVRLGDDMAIEGSGVNTKILIAGSSTANVSLFTTADGLTFSKTTVLTGSPAFSGTPHIDWDPSDTTSFWFRNTAGSPSQKYTISGSTATASGQTIQASVVAYGPFDVASYLGSTYMFLGIGNSAASTVGKPVIAFDVTNDTAKYYMFDSEYKTVSPNYGAQANLNGSGDVVVDPAGAAVYVLYTNNSVAKYNLPAAGVSDWTLY